MVSQLRKATQDIENPEFDKRCRYGLRSVERIKSGEKFTLDQFEERRACYLTYRGRNGLVPLEFRDALLAASEPFQPENWNDVQTLVAGSPGEWLAGKVLQHLVDSGRFTTVELLEIALQVEQQSE